MMLELLFVIAGWKQTDGLTEQQAAQMAQAAIHQDLAVDEDGQVCGIDEMWGWSREKDLKPDFPKSGARSLASSAT